MLTTDEKRLKKNEAQRKYREANKEAINAKRRDSSYDKVRYEKNRDKAKVRAAKYYKENKEVIKANTLKWQAANRAKCLTYCSKWRKANPGALSTQRAARRSCESAAIVPLDNVDASIINNLYIIAQGLSLVSGQPYHVDHRKPLSKGGKHHWANLQVITATENLRKGAK